jgi:hypothetical protein
LAGLAAFLAGTTTFLAGSMAISIGRFGGRTLLAPTGFEQRHDPVIVDPGLSGQLGDRDGRSTTEQ